MVEMLVLGIVLGLWVGFHTGYSTAVRRSGVVGVRTSLRRIWTGRL